jgi:hypothetical protein
VVSEVTTLEHELCKDNLSTRRGVQVTYQTHIRDDTVEAAAGVTEAMLASAELTEVLSCLGYHVIVELERDAASRLGVHRDIELRSCVSTLIPPSRAAETYEDVRPAARSSKVRR